MARIKKNFNLTREQIEVIVEALSNAECWKIRMGELRPEYKYLYDEEVQIFIDLELKLRSLIGKYW